MDGYFIYTQTFSSSSSNCFVFRFMGMSWHGEGHLEPVFLFWEVSLDWLAVRLGGWLVGGLVGSEGLGSFHVRGGVCWRELTWFIHGVGLFGESVFVFGSFGRAGQEWLGGEREKE